MTAAPAGPSRSPEPPDPVLGRVAEGVALRVQGRRADARRLLLEVWDEIGAAGEPLHHCSAAHALAGVQDDPAAELQWHLQALLAADQVSDAQGRGVAPTDLYPSLHLNLADVHHRLGDGERAGLHLQLGRSALPLLGDGAARDVLATAFERLEARVDALVAHPARG